jgi:hypothetical protein
LYKYSGKIKWLQESVPFLKIVDLKSADVYANWLLFGKDIPTNPGNRTEKLFGVLAGLKTAEFSFD